MSGVRSSHPAPFISNNMKRENWFVTPIWYDYAQFDFDAVARKCLELRATSFPNRRLSNVGGWQSQDIDLNAYDELKIVRSIIDQKTQEASNDISPNVRLSLDNVWININEKGNRNGMHVHPVSALSGTIYISVDDKTGRIVFTDRYSPIEHYPVELNESKLFYKNVFYTPKKGMIVIFPAWTHHEVEPNNSDLTRISISFNIKQLRD